MKRVTQVFLVGCFSALVLALSQGAVRAQIKYNPYQLRSQAAQYNMAAQHVNNQAAQILGRQYGAFYNANAYSQPFYSGPTVNPYAPTAPGQGVNPYTPAGVDPGFSGPYNPYNPYNPYVNGAGSVLMGQADIMRAYGTAITKQEEARIMREQAFQARLDTRKKAFDLEMYIKANTPTYTEEQERIASLTLRRIQSNSLPGEVVSGKSHNLLLADLGKFPGKKISMEAITLSDGVLARLNVTSEVFGVGVLRDNGRVTWPLALQERMNAKQRKDLDEQLQTLVKGANNSRLDANVLKDVRNEMERLREEMVKKQNDIPTGQYRDAKRFLQEFHEATRGLETGQAPVQAKFLRFVEEGKGRSVQEVADYMVKEGLRFAPATAADEAAYRALYSALAAYDVAMNSQQNVSTSKE